MDGGAAAGRQYDRRECAPVGAISGENTLAGVAHESVVQRPLALRARRQKHGARRCRVRNVDECLGAHKGPCDGGGSGGASLTCTVRATGQGTNLQGKGLPPLQTNKHFWELIG